jgi:hypothetical protein
MLAKRFRVLGKNKSAIDIGNFEEAGRANLDEFREILEEM